MYGSFSVLIRYKAPYKPDFKIDRINLCEAAIELIDGKNFPLTVVNEGKLETKFMPPQAFSDEQPSSTRRTILTSGCWSRKSRDGSSVHVEGIMRQLIMCRRSASEQPRATVHSSCVPLRKSCSHHSSELQRISILRALSAARIVRLDP